MYIIFANKPGEYSSEPDSNIKTLESWRYLFYGREMATFTIAEVVDESARIKIIDAKEPKYVNSVPNKLFGEFPDVSAARAEIEELISFADLDAKLEQVA
ncbi:ferredoxin [Oceanibium sediminis]|uniref:ferredoxin n=1 Tax=Oceanibium sediminis TaxID=2026339 RepID=UPI000DD47F10|nr:ferredoxin [Oceanibium sediminis]